MKKRIAMLAMVVFVMSVFVSVSQAGVAVSDTSPSISASDNGQDVACGEKCEKAKEGCKKSCDKKEGCAKKKEGCSKSEAKKEGCSKSGCSKKAASK